MSPRISTLVSGLILKYCMHGQSSSAVTEACDAVSWFLRLRPRVRGRQMLAVGLWAVVLLVVAADEDCSLLVVNSTMGSRWSYSADYGYCTPFDGTKGTKLRENALVFEGADGATLDSVRFLPLSYALPPGQPIRKECVTYTARSDGTKLTFWVGQHPSRDVADEFKAGATVDSVLHGQGGDPTFR